MCLLHEVYVALLWKAMHLYMFVSNHLFYKMRDHTSIKFFGAAFGYSAVEKFSHPNISSEFLWKPPTMSGYSYRIGDAAHHRTIAHSMTNGSGSSESTHAGGACKVGNMLSKVCL
jgi:hypothetical protein